MLQQLEVARTLLNAKTFCTQLKNTKVSKPDLVRAKNSRIEQILVWIAQVELLLQQIEGEQDYYNANHAEWQKLKKESDKWQRALEQALEEGKQKNKKELETTWPPHCCMSARDDCEFYMDLHTKLEARLAREVEELGGRRDAAAGLADWVSNELNMSVDRSNEYEKELENHMCEGRRWCSNAAGMPIGTVVELSRDGDWFVECAVESYYERGDDGGNEEGTEWCKELNREHRKYSIFANTDKEMLQVLVLPNQLVARVPVFMVGSARPSFGPGEQVIGLEEGAQWGIAGKVSYVYDGMHTIVVESWDGSTREDMKTYTLGALVPVLSASYTPIN